MKYTDLQGTVEIPDSLWKVVNSYMLPLKTTQDNSPFQMPWGNLDNWKEVARFESSTQKNVYHKVLSNGIEYKCTCRGYKASKTKKCKHIKSMPQLV